MLMLNKYFAHLIFLLVLLSDYDDDDYNDGAVCVHYPVLDWLSVLALIYVIY